MEDLKNNLMACKDAKRFVEQCWENSAQNSVAYGYIAGVIDSLRWTGRISLEEYNALYKKFRL